MINDHQIEWIRCRKYYSVFELHNLAEAAGVLRASADATQLPTILSAANGLAGLALATGDNYDSAINIPYDLDPQYPVGFRWFYTAEVTADATLTTVILTMLANVRLLNAQLLVASTALDTVLGTQTYGPSTAGVLDNQLSRTSRGIRTTLAMSRAQIEAGAMLVMRLTPSSFVNIVAASLIILGLEIDYCPIRCVGFGKETDAPLASAGF